jgi:hypothetical protein
MGKMLWWQDSLKLITLNAWCYQIICLLEIFANRTSWFVIFWCTPIFDMHILWWLANLPQWNNAIPTSNLLKCGSKTRNLPQWIFSQGIDILRFIVNKCCYAKCAHSIGGRWCLIFFVWQLSLCLMGKCTPKPLQQQEFTSSHNCFIAYCCGIKLGDGDYIFFLTGYWFSSCFFQEHVFWMVCICVSNPQQCLFC